MDFKVSRPDNNQEESKKKDDKGLNKRPPRAEDKSPSKKDSLNTRQESLSKKEVGVLGKQALKH